MLRRPSTSASSTSGLSKGSSLVLLSRPRAVARSASSASASPSSSPISTSTDEAARGQSSAEGAKLTAAKATSTPTKRLAMMRAAARSLVVRALVSSPATPAASPRGRASSSGGGTKAKKSGIELAAVATVPSSSSPLPSSSASNEEEQGVADIVLGIDPDTRGAMAVLFREGAGDEKGEAASSSSFTRPPSATRKDFSVAAVHDTPTVEVPLGRGTLKKPAKTRRRLDAAAVSLLVFDLKSRAESEGKSLEACVEQPSPSPLNGKLAWYGSGLAFGIWSGVLASHGVRTSFVRPQEWKRAFGLEGGGKDAARAAAVAALDGEEEESEEEGSPQASSPSSSTANTTTAAALLTRKKDHGRADAMLIALWRARGGAGWGGLGADAAAAAAEVEALALASSAEEGEEEATTADETDGTEFDDDDEEEEEGSSDSSGSSSGSSGSDEDEKAAAAAAVGKGKKTKGGVKAAAAKATRRLSARPAAARSSSSRLLGGSVVAAAGRSKGTRSFSTAALPASQMIDLASYTFIVDDIVFAPSSSPECGNGGNEGEGGGGGGGDGSGSVAFGQVGGSGPQVLFGFALAAAVLRRLGIGVCAAAPPPPPPLSLPSLALVAGIAIGRDDLPQTAARWLRDADAAFGVCRGVSWMGSPLRTPRAWQLVEGDGSRTQVWRRRKAASGSGSGGEEEEEAARAAALLPPLLSSSSFPSSVSIPGSVIENARAHHVGLDPLNPKHPLWLSALRAAVPPGIRITAETFQPASRFPSAEELRALLRPLDLFSPNEAEAASLVEGERGRSAASAARSLLLAAAEGGKGERGGEISFLDSVVVRRGGLGAVLVSRSQNRALSVPCVSGLRLRDTTGCGNAFLGALAASFSSSFDNDAALALGVASAAAAAVAEVLGTPSLSEELFSPSNVQVERAVERALAVRGACEEEVEV